MSPDLINGLFELFGGVFILNHCRALYRDKKLKGVSIISTIFFAAWGFWNLFYYPHLDQWISFAGGLLIVSANTLWIGMMLYYARKERKWIDKGWRPIWEQEQMRPSFWKKDGEMGCSYLAKKTRVRFG